MNDFLLDVASKTVAALLAGAILLMLRSATAKRWLGGIRSNASVILQASFCALIIFLGAAVLFDAVIHAAPITSRGVVFLMMWAGNALMGVTMLFGLFLDAYRRRLRKRLGLD